MELFYEYVGQAAGAGVFSLLASYALYHLWRIRGVVPVPVASILAAAIGAAAIAAVSISGGSDAGFLPETGLLLPGGVVGSLLARRKEKRTPK
jgi:hypothetical protein